ATISTSSMNLIAPPRLVASGMRSPRYGLARPGRARPFARGRRRLARSGVGRGRHGLRAVGRRCDDAHAPAVLPHALVADGAVDLREEGVVAAHSDVRPGVDPGPELPHEDVARARSLACIHLDAAPLSLAVAPVPGAALSLFVRHVAAPISDHRD